jgi:integrase
VFTGADGGLRRRANFRPRVWVPALAGEEDLGWGPIQPGMHFHDLRHAHKTWLIEDGVPQVLQHQRLGHKLVGASGIYSHVAAPMIEAMLFALQRRWQQHGTWSWADGRLPQGEQVA